jgi:uncharacterized integral membrane protein
MLYFKRFLLLALVALLGVFAFQNQTQLGQQVTLTFLKYNQTLVLGFWLLASFLAGSLIFLLVDLPRSFSLKRDLARKSQDLARVQFELNRAQAQPQGQSASLQVPPSLPGAHPMQPPSPGDLEKRLGL